MNIKDKIGSVGTGILLDIGKDFIAAVYPELYPLLMEWWEERQSEDGWTDLERLTYLYAMVTRIKQKEIGPGWADSVIDFSLQAWLKSMSSDIDKILHAPPPLPESEPEPEPDEDPLSKVYGTLFTEKPVQYQPDGDGPPYLWWNKATNPAAIRYTITKSGVSYPNWERIDW